MTIALDVLGSGAVILGPDVSCDGFHRDRGLRAQSHRHRDHLGGFSTSKSTDIVLSKPTYDLLSVDHPDFGLRANIHPLDPGEEFTFKTSRVRLVPSDHCLGAVQVSVTLGDGTVLGYSGDFSWPLDEAIKVNGLVVDATGGHPDVCRHYTQADAEAALQDLVKEHLSRGPVHLMADTGPAERALHVLTLTDLLEDVPIIGSKQLCHSLRVHRNHGYMVPEATRADTAEGRLVMSGGRYIRCWGLRQQMANDVPEGVCLRLTKYRTREVVEPWDDSGRAFVVGFSNHADFDGTIEYIVETGASYVVTDDLRGGVGAAAHLAVVLRTDLGIDARPSSNRSTLEWGG